MPADRYPSATWIESPNQDARPADACIDLIVLHNISLPPGEFGGPAIIDLFTNQLDPQAHPYYAAIANNPVSAHFLIRRDGQIIQFVGCSQRAWHAGVSSWQGRERCNEFSLGIELEGTDTQAFSPAQYASLQPLLAFLCDQYPIHSIAGHEHIAPGRKTDPGPFFDWAWLHQNFPLLNTAQ